MKWEMKEEQFGTKMEKPTLMMEEKSNPKTPSSFSSPLSFRSPSSDASPSSSKSSRKAYSKVGNVKKLRSKGSSFAFRIREHVRLGTKLSETLKGKLRLGARIVKEGGRENIFRHMFGVSEGEELLKASQCYLSTTAGPIAGILFVSTLKVAFCSETSLSFPSPTGQLFRTPYKVVIPTSKIKSVFESKNVEEPSKKYIEIVTIDNFDFWFMGFLRYEKALINLQKVVSTT